MCEYCGCQQIESIDELTREHEALVDAMGDLREHLAAGRLNDVAATCAQMLAVLGPHSQVEEEGLFPAMQAEFPDHVAALAAEHRTIHAVLAQAAAGPSDDPAWLEQLDHGLYLLREHILKEQDGVFPAALASLDGAQWGQVEAVRARAGSPLGPR